VRYYWGDTFAIRSASVGSGRECRTTYYPVGGRGGGVISSRLVAGFYLPYAGYRVHKR